MSKRLRRLVIGLALLAVLVAFGPTIASYPPLRDIVLRRIVPPVDGSVQATAARFSWLDTQLVDGLAIRDVQGRPLVTVDAISVDRSLVNLVLTRKALGTIRVTNPHVQLTVEPDGTNNLQNAFVRTLDAPPGKGAPTVALDVTGAKFTCAMPSAQTWSVALGPLRAAIRDDVPEVNGPLLTVEPTMILDNVELSDGLTRDVLQYIVPTLFGGGSNFVANVMHDSEKQLKQAVHAKGQVSLKIGEARFPLNDVKSGTIDGELTLHSVEVGGQGQILAVLGNWLQSPTQVQIAHETKIHFWQAGRRVHHEGLEFGVEYAKIRSRGSVGLDDESLDLLVELEINLPENMQANMPVVSTLVDEPFRVPIRGTLSSPQVDTVAMGVPATARFLETMKALQGKIGGDGTAPTVVGNVMGLINGQVPPDEAARDIAGDALDILNQVREERRRREQEAVQQGETPPAEEKPRRRIGRFLLNQLLDEAEKK